MPTPPLREFEYELYNFSLKERIELIDSKLQDLEKSKFNGDKNHLIDYYIQELNKMKKKTCTCIHINLLYLIYMIVQYQ